MPLELTSGQVPNVNHFRVFGSRVWVPVAEPHRKTIGSHRQEGNYVGFDSPSILRYVHPSNGTLHRARFQNCHFEESHFPPVAAPKSQTSLDFWAPTTFTLNPDPRTALADSEVQKYYISDPLLKDFLTDLLTLLESLKIHYQAQVPHLCRFCLRNVVSNK